MKTKFVTFLTEIVRDELAPEVYTSFWSYKKFSELFAEDLEDLTHSRIIESSQKTHETGYVIFSCGVVLYSKRIEDLSAEERRIVHDREEREKRKEAALFDIYSDD